MSFADRTGPIGTTPNWLSTPLLRYGFAAAAVGVATIVRFGLVFVLGFLPPFALFFLTIIVVALLAGFGPGIFATLLSAVSIAYFFWGSLSVFGTNRVRDIVGLVVFLGIGASICGLANSYRRREERLREFERVVEGLDEMIVVVDRDYRYVLANHVFLSYRGMKNEDVIGRPVSEILSPGVFDAEVKEKVDECFRGKVVQYEMRYNDPALGERDLVISYSPIEGPNGIDQVACVLRDITERKRAEAGLRLFRTLIDQSNDAVEVIDPETLRFLDVNEKACKDLGYTREELLALTVFDIDPNVDASCRTEVVERLRRAGYVVKEAVHRRKDGTTFPVETSLKYVEVDRSYVVAVSRDISDRKKAEEALREGEDRYRDLVEHSEDLVCTHDLEGNLLSVNPAPARLLGYEVAEMLEIPMRELIVSEYRELFDKYLERIKGNGSDKGLMMVQTKSGERRTWEYSNTLRTEGVATPIVRGMAHDITERRLAELAQQESEQRYRLLFEKNVAGVAICNMQGSVLDCNDAWAQMLGYGGAEEIWGRATKEFYFNPDEREPLVNELGRAGAFFSREMQLVRKDGAPVWVLFNCVVQSSDGGAPIMQATAIDMTKRKHAEQALRSREEDYRRFVAQSSEGIFREDLVVPIPIDVLEDELVSRIRQDAYVSECNDALAKMYGFEASREMIGKRLGDMLVPDDPGNLDVMREYVRAGFRILERETHEVDQHGNPKIFLNSMIGIVEDGKLVRTWGIQRDVTERVKLEEARTKAEEALCASESHFRILVEQASDGIFISDAQGKYLDVNSAGAAMLGYTREEILQLSISDVVVPDETARVAPEMSRFDGGDVIRSEWRFRRKDGSFFPGEVSGKKLPDGRLQGILRDISERRRAEEEMRHSEERFRVALKDSPITVFSQDTNLRYTWIYNPYHYWQREVVGKTDAEIIGSEKAGHLNELKRRVLHTGMALREEVQIPYDGKNYAFDLSVEPLLDASGNVIGITGSSMDIARLRELADGLQDAKDQLAREKSYLESEIQSELGFEEIIGQSPALVEVLKKARVVAPTDSSVLLLGETGTGKELVARSVHTLSARRQKNFIKLNCAAVPSGLLESELFGHEKGAFTSAVSQKVGRIELADKGTLFLDEIGELPLELQPKLLRVLQDREFERLGGVRTLHVDVRIISATNRDLQQDIADKKFREDLYYRLNVFPIQLPPLRERRSDIPMLVHYFVRKHGARMGRHIETIPLETMAVLQNWNWPGNIRELENMIERMVILTKGPVLAAPPVELDAPKDMPDDNFMEMEREHILRVLRETSGVLSGADGAASRLGIKRTTLQSMLKRLGIGSEDYRRRTGA